MEILHPGLILIRKNSSLRGLFRLVIGLFFSFLFLVSDAAVDGFCPFETDQTKLSARSTRQSNARRGSSVNYEFRGRLESKHTGATRQGHEKETLKDESKPVPSSWTIPKGVRFGRLDRLSFLPMEEEKALFSSPAPTNQQGNGSTGRIRLATKAIGLNFADIFTVLGLYSAANEERGSGLSAFVPGLEFAGTVLEDHPSGTYQKGDRVLGFTRFGAYSEVVAVPPEFLLPLPDAWTYAQGAGFLVQALTAWHGLVEIGRMPLVTTTTNSTTTSAATPPGNGEATTTTSSSSSKPFVVIVHSASGGVGLWASEIAARRGGTVLGIVGDASKVGVFEDRIVASGISPTSRAMIRGREGDFPERLARELQTIHGGGGGGNNNSTDDAAAAVVPSLSALARVGSGADMVMESLGGNYFRASFGALNDGGALVTFGSTTYSSPGRGGINLPRLVWRYWNRPRIDPGDLTARNLRICGFNLIFLTEQTTRLRRELSECVACLGGNNNNTPTVVDAGGNEDATTNGVPPPLLSLDGVTPPLIGETFDFRTEAVDALEKLKSGTTVGKVVLVNDADGDG